MIQKILINDVQNIIQNIGFYRILILFHAHLNLDL
jgi:hypothetical protein